MEPKFSRFLKAAAREGNTVTPMIRLAWENAGLHALARTPSGFRWGRKQLSLLAVTLTPAGDSAFGDIGSWANRTPGAQTERLNAIQTNNGPCEL